jgi:hypothetical protein
MAKVHNNIFVRGLTGTVGDQFVIRRTRSGKTIIANIPTFDEDREFTETQKTHHKAFREATTYARTAKVNAVYVNKAKGTGLTAYNLAVADWFGKPEVLEIDLSEWTGEAGQTIYVKAQDDTLVARVSLEIDNGNGTTYEDGIAMQSGDNGLWWQYTTKSAVSMASAPRIVATARDLPGNTAELTWQGE